MYKQVLRNDPRNIWAANGIGMFSCPVSCRIVCGYFLGIVHKWRKRNAFYTDHICPSARACVCACACACVLDFLKFGVEVLYKILSSKNELDENWFSGSQTYLSA